MSRRPGLGRGLGALLPTTSDARIVELDVDEIRPNPRQPRQEFVQSELEELASSIKELGLLQPVVVRSVEGGLYELLMGERRLRASRLAGVKRIPALVRETDDRGALEQALVENLQRSDLQPLEEAHAYRNLVDLFEITQEEVARRVGKSRVHITNTLRLLDLPASVRALLAENLLTAGHARALLAVKDPGLLEDLARKAVEEGLTVRQVEELARRSGEPRADRPASSLKRRRGKFPDLEETLSDHFGTVVQVEVGRGRGRVVISFGSRDDLERITSVLLGRPQVTQSGSEGT
ncbi:MAG TPA: ParB/RepB/Spo0J family partition protein [Actinomycetota bacterium]|nr:ParB/RepB/Spo0J family partition protein [Actinomycetota bacterium]